MNQRVHFYSDTDLSLGLQFKRIDELMMNKNAWSAFTDVNDVMELYEMQKVIEAFHIDDQKYTLIIPTIKKILGKFFSNIDSSNIDILLNQTNPLYRTHFWELVSVYSVFNRIDGPSFEKLSILDSFDIIDVLQQKKLVSRYAKEIQSYFMNHIADATLLIRKHLEKDNELTRELFFPECLTVQDRVAILWKYIDDSNADLTALELISKSRGNNLLPISPELRLAAKHSYQARIALLPDAPTITFGAVVSFLPMPNGDFKSQILEQGIIHATYDSKWIEENQDYATILNNFIYLFDFVNDHLIWTHISRPTGLSVIEGLIGMKGKREYITGVSFNSINMLANAQIESYYNFLKARNIKVENIIEWFFTDYLPTEFQVTGFYFNKPSEGISYLEMCRDMVIEIDSILKQFILYCKHGEIDKELFSLYTEHMLVSNVPSLYKDKYIYPKGDSFKKASYILFSDQALVHFIEEKTEQFSTLYETITSVELNINELQQWQKEPIALLAQEDILSATESGKIIYDNRLLQLMWYLYKNGCACSAYLDRYEKQIGLLGRHNMIYYGSTLLSEPEQHYFNYIFNGAEYDNSLDLRNKYAHGNQFPNKDSDRANYYIILRLFILIIIKINEEFCLMDDRCTPPTNPSEA